MICVGVQPARIDKLEPTDPPDFKPHGSSSSPSRSRALLGVQMAAVTTMVSNLPQPAYPPVVYPAYQFSSQHLQPWQQQSGQQAGQQSKASTARLAYEEEFLGAAIGQKRFRSAQVDEFAYYPGATSSAYCGPGPSVKVSRDMSGRSVDVATSRAQVDTDVSWAPLGEIVKKAMERSSPRAAPAAYSSSPSYTEAYSSDSGKHSDVSKHFSPPPLEGTHPSYCH